MSGSKRNLHEEPQDDQQSCSDEEPAADGSEDEALDEEPPVPPAGHATTDARKHGLHSRQAGTARPPAVPTRAPVSSKRRLPGEPQDGQQSLRKSSRLRH